MNARFPVDLHTHTTASDGSEMPAAVIARARRLGIQAIAITDHDTVAGLDEALDAGRAAGVEVLAGVELSIANQPELDFMELHILGYGMDHRSPDLLAALDRAAAARRRQKIATVEKLQALGFDVPLEEVLAAAGGGVLGRSHIAQVALARNADRLPDSDRFFRDYLTPGGKAYTPRSDQITLPEATALIRQAGGLPALAHPAGYRLVQDPVGMARRVASLGIGGIEGRYPYDKNRPHFGASAHMLDALIATYTQLAGALGLALAGGSDYHGARKAIELGEQGLTEEEYAHFRRRVLEGSGAYRHDQHV